MNLARWLQDDPVTGEKWIRITVETKRGILTQEYQVEQLSNGHYRLWRLDERFNLISYKVKIGKTPEKTVCSCDAYKYNSICKHAKALWRALDTLPF